MIWLCKIQTTESLWKISWNIIVSDKYLKIKILYLAIAEKDTMTQPSLRLDFKNYNKIDAICVYRTQKIASRILQASKLIMQYQ